MSGSPITAFATFMLAEGPATLSGPMDYVNDVRKQSYICGKHMSTDATLSLGGGELVQDMIYLEGVSQAVDYLPGASFSYTNPQPGTMVQVYERYTANFVNWTNQEILKNVGKKFTEAHNIAKFKDVKRMKMLNKAQADVDHFEAQFWALPDASTMEGSSGTVPLSIPAIINETSDATTAAVAATTNPGMHLNWSGVIANVDPTAKQQFQNYSEGYTSTGDESAAGHLHDAMEKMYMRLNFMKMPFGEYTGTETGLPAYIACSLEGRALVQRNYRQNQDYFRWSQMGTDSHVAHPTFGGIEIIYVSALDTAQLYSDDDGATFVDELDAGLNGGGTTVKTYDGPRFYFVNAAMFPKVINPERYMVKEEPRNPSGAEPFNWVMPCDTWHCNFPRSRRAHGIVYPSGASAWT